MIVDSEASTDERIIALETRIAYQDHLLASLDEVVREFAARVEVLERKLRVVEETRARFVETGPADEAPPHY